MAVGERSCVEVRRHASSFVLEVIGWVFYLFVLAVGIGALLLLAVPFPFHKKCSYHDSDDETNDNGDDNPERQGLVGNGVIQGPRAHLVALVIFVRSICRGLPS
jgi:hypothetical protein